MAVVEPTDRLAGGERVMTHPEVSSWKGRR